MKLIKSSQLVILGIVLMCTLGASYSFVQFAEGQDPPQSLIQPLDSAGNSGGVGIATTLTISPETINQGSNSNVYWSWVTTGGTGIPSRFLLRRCPQSLMYKAPVVARDAWGSAYQTGTYDECSSWTTVMDIAGSSFITASSEQRCTRDIWGNCSWYTADTSPKSGTSPTYSLNTAGLSGQNYVYQLTGYFGGVSGGSQRGQAIIPVTPSCNAFMASPSTMSYPGGNTTLTWNTSNATSVSIDKGIGSVATSGTKVAAVASTTVFTLTAVNGSLSCQRTAAVEVGLPPAPTATLEARNLTTGSSWSGNNFTIEGGQEVEVRWSSTNATSCSKSFTAGTALSGGPIGVTEPGLGGQTTYSMTCSGAGGAVGDSVTVTTAAEEPTFEINDADGLVRRGDTVEFTWSLNGNVAAQCSFDGPGAPASVAGASNPFEVAIQGASTYTLECPGGTAEVNIQVLPSISES